MIFMCADISSSSSSADRAKSIKTQATVNESPTDKLIRELREENAKLLEMIKKGNYQITDAPSGASEEGELKLKKKSSPVHIGFKIGSFLESYENCYYIYILLRAVVQ